MEPVRQWRGLCMMAAVSISVISCCLTAVRVRFCMQQFNGRGNCKFVLLAKLRATNSATTPSCLQAPLDRAAASGYSQAKAAAASQNAKYFAVARSDTGGKLAQLT